MHGKPRKQAHMEHHYIKFKKIEKYNVTANNLK